MRLAVELVGETPLLMHNARLSSPLNKYAQEIKELTSKTDKNLTDYWRIARLEWEGGMYFADPVGPFIPAWNLVRSIQDGGTKFRAGLKMIEGLSVVGHRLPLLYSGPRTLDEMWRDGEGEYVDMRPAGVRTGRTRALILRTRPMFPEWRIEAELVMDPDVLEVAHVQRALRYAGERRGLGDFHQIYGRFVSAVNVVDREPAAS